MSQERKNRVIIDQEFEINDDQEANWALKQIRDLQKKQEENNSIAEERITEIKEWLAEENEEITDQIQFFRDSLYNYFKDLRAKDPELKTKELPAGKIKARSQPPKWNYDEDKLLESVEKSRLDDLIRVKKSVNKRKLKERAKVVAGQVIIPSTGDVLSGVEVNDSDEKLSIDLDANID